MKRAFPWLLQTFLLAFAVLLVTQIVVDAAGLSVILDRYAKEQHRRLEDLAREILLNPASVSSASLSLSNPFFVFSVDKILIYSNRGKGRTISEDEYFPVRYQGHTIGYYYSGEIHFMDNQANRVFLSSLGVLGGASIVISLLIGIVAALSAARRIAVPVGAIKTDIQRIRALEEVVPRRFDITELTEISTDLSRVSSTLAGEEEYKRQWMRDLAHDLRTPLSGLKAQLEGMRDGVLEPTGERFSKNIGEVDRLRSLVESMGELSAVETLDEIDRERIETEEFLGRLTAPFEVGLHEKDLRLHVENDASFLFGDEDLLLRGIGNILQNAVTYVDSCGTIWISITEVFGSDESHTGQGEKNVPPVPTDGESDKNHIGPAENSPIEYGTKIEISNDGPDIPEDQIEKVFQRLYRGEFARNTPGSGLGLSIAQEIVHRHGGTIAVRPRTPRGVRFVVTLPFIPSSR